VLLRYRSRLEGDERYDAESRKTSQPQRARRA
jgi:hypothetical protein